MNSNYLYYFNTVAKFEHYTKAAEYLYISQPSLSYAIKSLEKTYGVKLFERDGRNIKLSKYGKLLYSYTSKSFEVLEDGELILRKFNDKNKGIVDFSFLFILGYQIIPLLIKTFKQLYPEKDISINLKQSTSADSIAGLKNGAYDFSLCTYIDNHPDINFLPIFKQELICITSNNHPLSKKDFVTIEEISQYPIIQYVDRIGELQTIIENLFVQHNKVPNTLMNLQEEMTIAGFVSTGINDCLAIVPNLDVLDSYNINKIKLDEKNAFRNIYLANNTNIPMAPCVKELYNFIKDALKDYRII